MRDSIINSSLNIIRKKNPNYDEEKIEILEYGLTGLYILITKSIIIFTISYFLGIFKELVLFMIIYNCIRSVSFGVHASSSSGCLIVSSISFIGAVYLCKYTVFPMGFKTIMGLIGIIYVYIYSPADTEKRPIINPKRRLVYKLLSTFISFVMVMISLIIDDVFIANSLIGALLMQCVMISPLTYKLANQKYDNYKDYLSN